MSDEFKVGAASVDISPKRPTLLKMSGLNRTKQMLGNLQDSPQCVDAIVFEAGGRVMVIVTSDIGVGRQVSKYRQAIAEKIGCDPMHIIVAGRHNHSAWGQAADKDNEEAVAEAKQWRERIFEGTVQACVNAYENRRPAEIVAGQATLSEPVGQNRRMLHSTGGVTPMWNSGPIAIPGEKFVGQAGPDATEIDFLFAREIGSDKPFAILTSYPTHIHLSGIYYFSAESVGGMKNAMAKTFPDAVLVYAHGTGGDNDMHATNPMPLDDEKELQWFIDSAKTLGERFVKALADAMPSEGYIRPDEFKHVYYTTKGQDPRINRMYELNALALGNVAIVTIPHEMFIEFGNRMHEANPFDHLIPISFSSAGRLGYMGTPLHYEQGGYELSKGIAPSPAEEQKMIDAGIKNRAIGRARVDTGEQITQKVIDVLNQLDAK